MSFRLARAGLREARRQQTRSLRLTPLRGGMSEDDKVFYALGLNIAQNLGGIGPLLNDKEADLVGKGIIDALKSDTDPDTPLNVYGPKINEMVQTRMAAQAEAAKAAGLKALETAAEEDNAVKTDSGLVVQTIKEGDGASPSATDTVKVHYHGTLADGTVFDSSVERGEPIAFPLNRVIAGWTEGLQLMKEGGKAKLTVPSDLAYGDAPQGDKIPGGSTLIFEVELLEIQ